MGAAVDEAQGLNPDQWSVLIVEDNALLRISTADFLRGKGYRVIEAGTVIEAATVLNSGQPVHAVFTDVHLPGPQGGLSLAVWMRSHHPATPVILTSGVQAIMPTLGGQHDVPFVSKPYELEKLPALLAQVITEHHSKHG